MSENRSSSVICASVAHALSDDGVWLGAAPTSVIVRRNASRAMSHASYLLRASQKPEDLATTIGEHLGRRRGQKLGGREASPGDARQVRHLVDHRGSIWHSHAGLVMGSNS